MYDYIVVGAGFAGCVIAERIANILDKKVLVIEKRDHIGGNCYDYYDKTGILVHKYGPHIFHTNLENVWKYLNNFTEWLSYQHEVLGFIDGKYVPIPFNLNTLNALFPEKKAKELEYKLINNFGFNEKIPILELKKIQEFEFLAEYVYEKVFLNYTEKQWGMKPEELDPSVTERVPILISKDNRYFQDKYQGMPKQGYTKIFEKMLENDNINIILNTDYKKILSISEDIYLFENKFEGKLIFTGKIDEFFDYKFGELPYRSLRFDFENLNHEYFQKVGTVNFPNDYDYTRITEFKHLTGQKDQITIIVKEFPQEHDPNIEGKDIPYYPIPKKENDAIYEKYQEESNKLNNVFFVGRLAEYMYYNMDLVIERALKIFEEVKSNE